MKKYPRSYAPKRPYKECPHCGAALDSGERCDCPGARAEQAFWAKLSAPAKAAGQ